jgi:hypothetical protein
MSQDVLTNFSIVSMRLHAKGSTQFCMIRADNIHITKRFSTSIELRRHAKIWYRLPDEKWTFHVILRCDSGSPVQYIDHKINTSLRRANQVKRLGQQQIIT